MKRTLGRDRLGSIVAIGAAVGATGGVEVHRPPATSNNIRRSPGVTFRGNSSHLF